MLGEQLYPVTAESWEESTALAWTGEDLHQLVLRYPQTALNLLHVAAGRIFVSHTGDVYPSGFLPLAAGNVRRDSLVDVYRSSELFVRLRDTGRLHAKCGRCPFREICGGSRARAYAHTGDPMASDPLCAYQPL